MNEQKREQGRKKKEKFNKKILSILRANKLIPLKNKIIIFLLCHQTIFKNFFPYFAH